MQQTVTQLDQDHRVFDSQNMRGGYMALSDIQRALQIIQQAVTNGAVSDQQLADLTVANDMLFVRANNFSTVSERDLSLPSSDSTVASIMMITDAIDAGVASGFADLDGFWQDLLGRAQQTRQELIAHLEKMLRFQDDLLRAQSRAVEKQRNIVWATLFGLMLFASVALLLLRREVMANKARQRAEARIAHLAFHDSLTGLGNRLSFQERLGRWLDRDKKVALIIVDIDEFKQVNDTYGHAAGDAVLNHVAATLQRVASRQNGFAARLGGDEFALAVKSTDLKKMGGVCDHLLKKINEGFLFEGELITTHASIGMATTSQISDTMALTVDGLTRAADFALYAAKAGGRRRSAIYDKDLEAQFIARRDMIEELPGAIKREEMEIFLQPKVRFKTSQIYGFEALVRWRRGGRLVPPGDFISTAEESGQIIELDRFVLRKASRIMAEFNAEHGTEYGISVNFCALQFNSARCCTVIEDVLAETGLPPHLLTIEVTETAELADWGHAKPIIKAIQNIGVRIAIDDFGAGFSSLAYLRSTFADEIKIDRSLVVDLETSDTSRFLLDSVIEIARNLDLEVTVEGIETQEQLQIVLPMEPMNGQGYLWSKPMPAYDALQSVLQTPYARTA